MPKCGWISVSFIKSAFTGRSMFLAGSSTGFDLLMNDPQWALKLLLFASRPPRSLTLHFWKDDVDVLWTACSSPLGFWAPSFASLCITVVLLVIPVQAFLFKKTELLIFFSCMIESGCAFKGLQASRSELCSCCSSIHPSIYLSIRTASHPSCQLSSHNLSIFHSIYLSIDLSLHPSFVITTVIITHFTSLHSGLLKLIQAASK